MNKECKKCGLMVHPKYHKDGSDCNPQKKKNKDKGPPLVKIEDHLHYYCSCGFNWRGPTKDREDKINA